MPLVASTLTLSRTPFGEARLRLLAFLLLLLEVFAPTLILRARSLGLKLFSLEDLDLFLEFMVECIVCMAFRAQATAYSEKT